MELISISADGVIVIGFLYDRRMLFSMRQITRLNLSNYVKLVDLNSDIQIPLIVKNMTLTNITLEVEPSYIPFLKESNRQFRLIFISDPEFKKQESVQITIEKEMIDSPYQNTVSSLVLFYKVLFGIIIVFNCLSAAFTKRS